MPRTDWNLHARARACRKCGAAFEAGSPVRTGVLPFPDPLVQSLFADKIAEDAAAAAAGQSVKPPPEYLRLDFCDACWKGLDPRPEWISVWKSAYVPPPATPEDPLKKASPEELLRRLVEGEDPENHLAPIYLLAVMLERKRILVERAVRNAPDGSTVRVYEHRRTGDVLFVTDPRLEDAEIPEVQAEIERLLGLRPSVESVAAEIAAEAQTRNEAQAQPQAEAPAAPAADGAAAPG